MDVVARPLGELVATCRVDGSQYDSGIPTLRHLVDLPITTSKMVALSLAKSSGLPWVADFRDPMSMKGYPSDSWRFKWARRIETATIARASRVIFTAEYTRRMYQERYPDLADRALLIPNGFDDSNFPTSGEAQNEQTQSEDRRLTIVHSGAMQPDGRHPGNFFRALKILKTEGTVSPDSLRIILRASGSDEPYRQLAKELGVDDLVGLEGYVPYEQAIQEMVAADGLLLFQGTVYNHAVPAKLYEYLNARKPLFALVDKAGEAASVLQSLDFNSIANIDDTSEIVAKFRHYVEDVRRGTYTLPAQTALAQFSRREQVGKLSKILESVIESHGLEHS